jgi:ER degradation enhancer, mannosidase alpha-like 1
VGPHAVHAGQKVHITDALFASTLWKNPGESDRRHDTHIVFKIVEIEMIGQRPPLIPDNQKSLRLTGFSALFGADVGSGHWTTKPDVSSSTNLKVIRPESNLLGCNDFPLDSFQKDDIVLIDRGGCTFVEKLRNASKAGASAVIVISDKEEPLNPSSDPSEKIDDLVQTGLVVITQEGGNLLLALLDLAQSRDFYVTAEIEPDLGEAIYSGSENRGDQVDEGRSEPRYIFLAGKPILNMIIMT